MSLTPKQKEVVEATEGHYVVLAGPGCGKTHTITEKILHIFEKEAIPEPCGLLAVTFTDFAARIMRARLRSKGFSQWDRVWVGTFHSFGRHILGCYGSDIGIQEDFEIIEVDKRDLILHKIIEKHLTDVTSSEIKTIFDGLKRRGIYSEQGEDNPQSDIREAYKEYNQILRDENLLDFGDLVALAVQLFQKSDFVKRLYTRFFSYVIVDEFQDTDKQQLEMIRLLAEPAIGSTIVGDDDQSIFGWRGALRENVYNIKELLGSTEIVLSHNFRSDEVIVEAAAKVIGFDSNRRDKNIEAVSKERGYLYGVEFNDPEDEAQYVIGWISEILGDNKVSDPGNIAIITRVRYRAECAVQKLDEVGISWFDRFRLNFQDSWETALALAVIELAHNHRSSLYLHRVLVAVEEGGLAFRLGDKDALDVALRIRDQLKSTENLEFDPNKVHEILDAAGLEEIIQNTSTGIGDAKRRMTNIEKMMRDISSEAEKHDLDLIHVTDRFLGHGAIQIRSSHQSKGGEFDVVFFIGLEDDILPDYRTHKDDDKIAEERRIFYVGLTRARKVAYLTSVSHRPMLGWVKDTSPSRFMGHIPDEYFSEVTL
ncbi:MAG: ATP-dependent helicase [Candidatus Altiarchaeota archaeon]|nr:ATP-dependent helicase [Candidatus Altiarchaeota archaeon]